MEREFCADQFLLFADFCTFFGHWLSKNASRDHGIKGEFVSFAKPIVLCTIGKRILCWSIFAIDQSINWSLYLMSFKSSCQLLPCSMFCSKPVMLNFVEEVSRFCLVVFLNLFLDRTDEQFHSYKTILEYEPDQGRNPFFISVLVLSVLSKPYTSDSLTI